jgi:hypothetical protein
MNHSLLRAMSLVDLEFTTQSSERELSAVRVVAATTQKSTNVIRGYSSHAYSTPLLFLSFLLVLHALSRHPLGCFSSTQQLASTWLSW